MVGNIGAALSAITFPLLTDKETGSANHFFMLAASLNVVAILAWCIMNPNRVSDRKLSPAALRRRFIIMLSSLFVLTSSVVGFNLYKAWKKTHQKPKTQQVVPEVQNDILSPDSPGDSN